MKRKPIRQVKAHWSDVVLVCRKCSKRLRGGFGPKGDQRLGRVLRETLRATDGKTLKGRRARIGIIEVGCFDICPKDALIAVRASTPGRWSVIPRRTPTAEILAQLGLAPDATENVDEPGAASPDA